VEKHGAGVSKLLLRFGCRRGHNTHALLTSGEGFVNNQAVCDSKQGIILAKANVQAGFDAGSTLPNQNVARDDFLASVLLDAKALRIAVTTVATGTTTLFMCHCSYSTSIELTCKRVYC